MISSIKDSTNSLFNVKEGTLYWGKQLVVPNKVEQDKIITLFHDSLPAVHAGYKKKLERIKVHYWWPHITAIVKKYISNCFFCIWIKNQTSKPSGLLQPLPIPDGPWQSFSMDFITQLPCSNFFDAILVIVDCFTKEAYFCLCNNTTLAKDTANIYLKNIFPYHGIPQDIVSNRGTQFTSVF